MPSTDGHKSGRLATGSEVLGTWSDHPRDGHNGVPCFDAHDAA